MPQPIVQACTEPVSESVIDSHIIKGLGGIINMIDRHQCNGGFGNRRRIDDLVRERDKLNLVIDALKNGST